MVECWKMGDVQYISIVLLPPKFCQVQQLSLSLSLQLGQASSETKNQHSEVEAAANHYNTTKLS